VPAAIGYGLTAKFRISVKIRYSYDAGRNKSPCSYGFSTPRANPCNREQYLRIPLRNANNSPTPQFTTYHLDSGYSQVCIGKRQISMRQDLDHEEIGDAGLRAATEILRVIAHPVRPRMIPLILQRPLNVPELAEACDGPGIAAAVLAALTFLAGIVTRDSIILVDFIHLSLARGRSLFDAIMESRVVRLRPILLTASAAMLGAIPIIIDPIFSGLAWSLIFGLLASTVFTLFVIPVVYWLLYANTPGHGVPQSSLHKEDDLAEMPVAEAPSTV
jgi:hypothetical protein